MIEELKKAKSELVEKEKLLIEEIDNTREDKSPTPGGSARDMDENVVQVLKDESKVVEGEHHEGRSGRLKKEKSGRIMAR